MEKKFLYVRLTHAVNDMLTDFLSAMELQGKAPAGSCVRYLPSNI